MFNGVISENCHLKYDGVLYTNIKLIGPKCGSEPRIETPYVASYMFNEIKIHPLPQKIPTGSKIYLANNIPIDIETIRKSYVIKRKAKDADYVIMNPNITHSSGHYVMENRFYKNDNILISTYYMEPNEIEAVVTSFGLKDKDYVQIPTTNFYATRDPKGSIAKYFTNSFPKPLASYIELDLQTGDDLDYDVLSLTYRLGCKYWTHTSNDINNYVLNIKALNNYNWRKYKGTLGIMFRCMKKDVGCCHYDVFRSIKSQSKTIYDVINTCQATKGFDNEDDLRLSQEFFSKILNIEQFPMFVYPSTLFQKIFNANMNLSDFEKIFNTITKITKNVELKNEN